MAASTTVGRATAHFSTKSHIPSTTLKSSNNVADSCSFAFLAATKRARGSHVIRSSSSEVPAETTASETPASEAPVEVWKEPSSLISALNVEKALRGIAITDADHYGRLGLRRGCSYEQVSPAYKNKVEELTKQQGLEEEELAKNLELLKESYSILSSVEERRLYDWSLSRSENPDRYMWPFEADITQTPAAGTPPPQDPEDVEPTRLVGYFIAGWLILSFALSIVLNG